MGKAIEIRLLERSAAALRELAARARDGAVVRRLRGIALLLDGWSRGEAAAASGMDRQTLCDWVHRYNVSDVAGLETGKRSGRPPALSDAQMAELKALVIKGPDPETDGVVRWRCVDLRAAIARLYSVQVDQRTVVMWLRKFNLTRLQPRPYHPKKGAEAQETFKHSFAGLVIEALPTSAAGKPLGIWFQDEARVGQKGWIPYQWAPVGSRPPAIRDNRHDSVYFPRVKPEDKVRCDLPGSAGWGRYHHARRQHRGDKRASERDQYAGAARCACCADLRRRRMASTRQDVGRSSQHHTDAPASLFTGTEFDGKCGVR
jgi:transposase